MTLGWSLERTNKLIKLHGEGLSASQIAKQLGGTTRNSVIGKRHRLGLKRSDAMNRYNRAWLRTKNGFNGSARKRKAKPAHPPEKFLEAALAEAVMDEEPERGRVALIDLAPNACKWPYGDPKDADFGFCGEPKTIEGPYCEKHKRLAFAGLSGGRRS